jgi:small subunit ribosomal protein S9
MVESVEQVIPVVTEIEAPREPKVDELGRAYGTGRRKKSTARVWIKRGTGQFIVNGKTSKEFFARDVLRMMINQVFEVTDSEGSFDVWCTVKGGGLSGQAGAIRHGIARALDNFNPIFHKTLRVAGFLTRDSRRVERKKPGQPKARKSFQFSKR